MRFKRELCDFERRRCDTVTRCFRLNHQILNSELLVRCNLRSHLVIGILLVLVGSLQQSAQELVLLSRLSVLFYHVFILSIWFS